MTFLDCLNSPKCDFTQIWSGGKLIKFQQSQALTSHFESFWSIVDWILSYLKIVGPILFDTCLGTQRVLLCRELCQFEPTEKKKFKFQNWNIILAAKFKKFLLPDHNCHDHGKRVLCGKSYWPTCNLKKVIKCKQTADKNVNKELSKM